MKLPGEMSVSSKITPVEPRPARIAPGSAARAVPGATTGAGSAAPSEDGVQLTGAARSLASIEQSLRALPALDELRVAAVKQRLEDGSYEIDPQRVADRLLRMENDLARAVPLKGSPLK
jgi:negative regulator of flagellin synthesis FlgM